MIPAYSGLTHLLSEKDIAIKPRGGLIAQERNAIDRSRAQWDSVRTEANNGGYPRYPTLEEGTRLKDIGKETFKVFESPKTLEPFLRGVRDEITGQETPYFCQTMSARQLETAHLVPGEHAPHVHPSQPGLHTGSLNDQKRLRVLWRMTLPEDRDLHPPESRMVDGRLIAVWRTSTEQKCSPKLRRQLKRLQGRVADRLGGNKYALKRSVVKRVLGGLKWRFHSLFRGAKEGSATPRNIGRIASVVVLISVPFSVGIWGAVMYGIQFHEVRREINKIRTQDPTARPSGRAPAPVPSAQPPPYSTGAPPPPYSAVAPTYPTPQAYAGYAGSSGNGTTSLSA